MRHEARQERSQPRDQGTELLRVHLVRRLLEACDDVLFHEPDETARNSLRVRPQPALGAEHRVERDGRRSE
ncbi:MAG TPA: hypothetical protein VMD28_10780 [Acidimicrobiales bacterium]|nr:hypothetical protein [Acidimicrobiales bacterium]